MPNYPDIRVFKVLSSPRQECARTHKWNHIITANCNIRTQVGKLLEAFLLGRDLARPHGGLLWCRPAGLLAPSYKAERLSVGNGQKLDLLSLLNDPCQPFLRGTHEVWGRVQPWHVTFPWQWLFPLCSVKRRHYIVCFSLNDWPSSKTVKSNLFRDDAFSSLFTLHALINIDKMSHLRWLIITDHYVKIKSTDVKSSLI